MVLELNASDDRGIAVVRNQITSFAGTRKLFDSGVKLIILDEADALTKDAQAALRRVIEKFSKTTRFCLICNYVSKIIPAIQSRCTRFRFAPLSEVQMKSKGLEIAKLENVKLGENGIESLTRCAEGDMRKLINTLQATHLAFDEVNETNVYKCLGRPTPQEIKETMNILMNENVSEMERKVKELSVGRGLSLIDLLRGLIENYLRDGVDLPQDVRGFLLESLAEIEWRLSGATSDVLQRGDIIGTFMMARELLRRGKK
jgi:replication factor C subunit 3/5